MEHLDLEKLEKNIELYKYMLWSATALNQDEIGLEIIKSVNEGKTELFDYLLSVNVSSWSDANLEDVTIKLNNIRTKIENFISEYQIDSKGKISRNPSKKFKFMGPLLINLKYEIDNEELFAHFEYHIETEEEK